jgi:hypothetical protein
MTTQYSIPAVLLLAGAITGNAIAGDITNKNNEMRNETAVGYEFGFNDDYHLAVEVFGQRNPGEHKVNNYAYGVDESSPVDDFEIWGLNDGRADLDWTTGVRLRPGVNITNNTRLFLDGGVVFGDFSMELTDSANTVGAAQMGADDMTQSSLLRGIRYGAGIEHQLKNISHLRLVLDYSMTEFESAAINQMPTNMMATTADDMNNVTALDAPAYQQVTLSVKAEFDPGLGF